ncbi:DAO-domain-containing protein [Gigaspora margarita]|uniref:Glycerol-3-phosphate dehydrogenase n=1 Tax=Gigaspora margarita TaxID=4874 RepID=A0A8H4ATM5_GIGMA|nr:DAO-domain-containing protein [Gigaspora margarita]
MFRTISKFHRTTFISLGTITTASALSYYIYADQSKKFHNSRFLMSQAYADAKISPVIPKISPLRILPSRDEMINNLKCSNKNNFQNQNNEEFDLLIIGGGATGTGAALDAATRGLKVALVERDDFASGTSSRSTKLIHGGVRYLEKAIYHLDYEQYKLVREALHERATFLNIAPYLSHQLPIMLPLYRWWEVPYYWVGLNVYNFLAGKEAMGNSYYVSRDKVLEEFPWLKKDNLVGAIVYYDGQHNDARMNVAIALTAISHGATVANHVEVTHLLKNEDGKIVGARVRDNLNGDEWDIKSKGVINATGVFADNIISLDKKKDNMIMPASGVHIILPNYYSLSGKMGMLDKATSDGRVLFVLPWEGNTLVGTTDSPTEVSFNPMPKEEEIVWVLNEFNKFLTPETQVRRDDVLAAWAGIRPLVIDPEAKDTSSLVRSHMIHVNDSNLITITGGKWTTYRNMAKETIDKAIEVFDLNPLYECQTENEKLIGSQEYSETMFIRLIQKFGLDTEVAKHLANDYGDRSWDIMKLVYQAGSKQWPAPMQRISSHYPYIDAEIRYAIRQEFACTVVDVIARRTRLAFLNPQATLESLPHIIEIMSEELNWTPEKKKKEFEEAVEFLKTMGLPKSDENLSLANASESQIKKTI